MSGSRSVLELCVSLDSSASGFRWRRPADSFDGSCFLLQRQEDVLMMLAFASQCFRAGRPASLSVWDVRPLWRSGTLWRSGLAVIRREEGSAAPCGHNHSGAQTRGCARLFAAVWFTGQSPTSQSQVRGRLLCCCGWAASISWNSHSFPCVHVYMAVLTNVKY